ncbi:ATP-dependent Clp protease proteolytic subunit precursor [compost metagenome]
MKDRLDEIFAQATGKTAEQISADTQRDLWLSAKEAVEYGLVNKIIVSEKEITQPKR